MREVWAALDAFLQEHRHCGELDAGVEDLRVWMTCDCGAGLCHWLPPPLNARLKLPAAEPPAVCFSARPSADRAKLATPAAVVRRE